ncbi:hypothetical protein GCM10022217_08850 [Chryseobacterium ginsenosidimutans]
MTNFVNNENVCFKILKLEHSFSNTIAEILFMMTNRVLIDYGKQNFALFLLTYYLRYYLKR